jgi:hypothetical protein
MVEHGVLRLTSPLLPTLVRSLASRLVLYVDGRPWRWAPEDPLHECDVPEQIAAAGAVSIAHPVDLHAGGALVHWQQQAVEQRLPQPFKQVFREIYVVGERELASNLCDRFTGRPLIARQAFALLRRRGYAPGTGEAVKEWARSASAPASPGRGRSSRPGSSSPRAPPPRP